MPGPKKANREQKRQQKAAELLHAAERLIAGGMSISELTVDNLRTEAGMARSTFYVYFEDKIDLINVLMEQLLQETLKPVKHWWEIADHGSQKELANILLEAGNALMENRIAYQWVEETSMHDEDIKQSHLDYSNAMIRLAQKSVLKAQKEKAIRKDVTPEMVESLHWMVNKMLVTQAIANTPKTLPKYCASLASIMWRTLYEN
jgi:TetR/AcrR family transcriptional regulator, ethionamide resistance regulator